MEYQPPKKAQLEPFNPLEEGLDPVKREDQILLAESGGDRVLLRLSRDLRDLRQQVDRGVITYDEFDARRYGLEAALTMRQDALGFPELVEPTVNPWKDEPEQQV
jgi:hypothetical protein